MALNSIEKLRIWCHKVLPLVYDDSLSYYEVLAKVVNKLNEVIALAEEQNETIEEALSDIETFETDLTSQFEAYKTTLDAALDAFEAEITAQQSAFEGRMTQAFADFLADYEREFGITNLYGDSTTLAISQNQVSKLLDYTTNNNRFNPEVITSGKAIDNTGAVIDNPNTAVTGYIEVQPGENIVAQAKNNTTNERYQGAGSGTDVPLVFDSIAGYDEDLTFVSGSFKSLVFNYQVPVGVKYIKIAMGQTILDGTNTDMSELAIVNSDGTIYPYQPYSEQNATVKMNALPVDDTQVGNHLWSANKINAFQAAVEGEIGQLETDLTGTVQGAIGDMNTAFTQKSAELDTKFDTLEGSIQAEQEAFETEIEGALASQKTELETEIGEIASDVQTLSGSVATQGQAITNLSGIVTNIEERVDTLETDMAAAKADISDLEDSDAQQSTDITDLKGRMTTAEGNINSLETASGQHATAISNLQAKDAELVGDINGLTTRVGSAEGDIDLLEDAVNTNTNNINDLKESLYPLQEKVTGFTGNLIVSFTDNQFYPQNYVTSRTPTTNNSWCTTALIPVQNYKSIKYNGLSNVGTTPYSVFFDDAQNPVSTFKQTTGENTLDVPDGVYYVSFSVHNNDKTTIEVFGYTEDNIEANLSPLIGLETKLPTEYQQPEYENKSLSSTGAISDSTNRLLSKPFNAVSGDKIIYYQNSYRFAEFNNDGTFKRWILANFASGSYTFNQSYNNVRINIKKANDSDISVNEGATSVTVESESLKTIADTKEIFENIYNKLTKIEDPFNLEINNTGNDNMIWSWWVRPIAKYYKRVRNCIYFGFTTSDGYSGIAQYNIDTKLLKKTILKQNDIDDHNACAFLILNDGTILTTYSGGHNVDKFMYIRKSTAAECIDSFTDVIKIPSASTTTYAQLFEYNGTIYLFYRTSIYKWAFVKSEDNGDTWSSETILITSTEQYYCLFRETNTNGVLRILMTANPNASDVNIREGFLHLDTETLYNADNVEELGTNNVASTDFTVLIAKPASGAQRLFDCAISAIDSPLVLYTTYTTSQNPEYFVHNGITNIKICDGGPFLLPGRYPLGCAWMDDTHIISIRGTNDTDIVEIYEYSNGEVTLSDTVFSELKGELPIRNARPIACYGDNYVLWERGYYSGITYTDFDMDAKLYDAVNDTIVF